MKTILTILRFPFNSSGETQSLIERGITWKEIFAILLIGAILVQTGYNIFRGIADHYIRGYPLSFDFSDFGYLIISTVVIVFILEILSFMFFRVFGGKGSFKIHMGTFALLNVFTIPVLAITLVSTTGLLGVSFPTSIFLVLIAFVWRLILISKSLSIVHEFSKTRAMLAAATAGLISIVVLGLGYALILGVAFSGAAGTRT